ncbi:hypothetical protein ECG_08669 [Echinococcus granulosus]|nr:hypothetical protein ECG_08669 [Echinococcus granulosus]
MSHTGGDIGNNAPPVQAWNRTPGKPSLPNLSGNLPNASSWGGKKKVNPTATCSDASASGDVWPLLTDPPLSRKNEPSQWPTPAELAGTSRNDTINDFSIPNAWSSPGTSLALRTLGDAEDRNDSWPPLDTAKASNPIDPVSMARAITGSGNLVSGDSAFNSRQQIHSVAGGKPRNEGFSSWGPSIDGDFSAFANHQLPPTSDKTATNCQQPGDALCPSASDSGNHIDGQSEAAMIINTLINSKECWGQHPVDQATPWDMALLNEELASNSTAANSGNHNSTGLLGDAISLAIKHRRPVRGSSGITNAGVPVESNVWSSEPPTGTSIWEMHYESLGDRSGRWKQSSSSSSTATAGVVGGGGSGSRLDVVASPPGSHRIVSSFMSPSPVQQQQQGRGGCFQNNFFPSQPQQRFGQAALQPPGSGRGVFGPNSLLSVGTTAGGGFKSQASAVAQASAGWSLPLTPDSQSPLEDSKRFLASSGPWSSEGRGLGKQQHQQLSLGDTTRWPSPLAQPSSASIDSIPSSSALAAPLPWQGGMDPRKFVPWSQQTAVVPQPPSAAAPQRFHLRQNTSVLPAVVPSGASVSASSPSAQPLRLLAPNAGHQHHTHPHHAPSTTTALLRTDIARQLMLLGFHDDAGALLSDNGIEDLEKFLYDLRERTGGMHPGLNQLINSVSTVLMPAGGGGSVDLQQPQQLGPPPQAFDLFDNRGSGAASHLGKQHFAGRQNSASPSDALGQLLMRATHLQTTIIQLDKKKRELNMKHSQLRKMNMGGPTAHHSNSLLQEIVLQQAQISQQIEAQEAQLGQARLQIAFLTRITTGGGGGIGNEDSTAAAAATAAMLMRLRSGGGSGGVGPPPTRMMNHPMGGFGGGGPRGSGMLLSSPPPSSDLAPRLADLKLSMDVGRRMPWDGGGGGAWDVPSPHQFSHVSSSNTFLNSDPTSNVFPLTSSTIGDRRWATSNSSSDFHQPPAPSPSTTTAVAAATNAIWNASWLLLSDLTPQFSLEVLRISITTALDQQQQQQNVVIGDGGGGASNTGVASSASTSTYEVHPNLPARYVLVGFLNPPDASVVSTFISSTTNSTIKLANSVTIISPAEAMAKLQEIKTLDDELQQQQQQQTPSQQQTPQQQGNQLTWPPTNALAGE